MSRRPKLRIVVHIRAVRPRLVRFMTGSFAVHGLLFAAIVIVPATRRHAIPIEDTMVVALAGPIGAPPAARAAAAPPAAKPAAEVPKAAQPPPKEAHTVREVPAPKPKEKPKKPVKPAETPLAAQAPKEPPAASSGHAGPATGAAGAAPAPGTSAVTATLGIGDASLSWYGAAVKAALEAAWIKPVLEDATGTASVVVAFDIARDGATRNLRVQQSSGIPSLDRSAQRAVIDASPLPGIPPSWSGDAIPVTMRFDLTPDTR